MEDLDRLEDVSDEDTKYLDDVVDRAELRDRYYGLLQELRVVLPGVQVLLAFLLTAPFAAKFDDLDSWGRRAYQVALTSSMLSVTFLLSPTFLHRFGERTAPTRPPAVEHPADGGGPHPARDLAAHGAVGRRPVRVR